MVLPGFFVEYLITGSCALLWLFGVFRLVDPNISVSLDTARIALLAPALYVLGMLIDFCSRQPLMNLRDRLKRGESRTESDSTFNMSLQVVWARSTELAKQADIRRSRDRIARGAVGNFLIGTIVFSISAFRDDWPIPWWSVLIAGSILTFVSVLMWLRFDRLTWKFTRNALKALNESEADKAK